MRNFGQTMRMVAIGAGVFLFCAGRSNAQVVGSTTVSPFTGQVISTSSGFNPLTNQIGTSQVLINPVTGQQVAVGIGQNPVTGTIFRTDVVRNPVTGATITLQQRF